MESRVLVVDDSALVREELTRLLDREGGFRVVASAPHGVVALELAEAHRPDLVTLDVRMPVMDGLATLKRLMTNRPVATVMVSALTRADSHVTFDCLRYGALDFVHKPGGDPGITMSEMKSVLVDRLRRASNAEVRAPRFCRGRTGSGRALPPDRRRPEEVLLVSAGQSGLGAVIRLASSLRAGSAASVVVSVDAHPVVVESLASYLPRFCALDVVPAREAELAPATIYLAPSSEPLMLVRERARLALRSFPTTETAGPVQLVESLFASAAEAFRSRTRALFLSGGTAGAVKGAERILEAGGETFAEIPWSALEPRVVETLVQRGLATMVGDPEALIERLTH